MCVCVCVCERTRLVGSFLFKLFFQQELLLLPINLCNFPQNPKQAINHKILMFE